MKQHQGARLVAYIRRHKAMSGQWPTYGDLLATYISTCPWRRMDEPGAQSALRKGERIVRGKDAMGRVTFQITRRKA